VPSDSLPTIAIRQIGQIFKGSLCSEDEAMTISFQPRKPAHLIWINE